MWHDIDFASGFSSPKEVLAEVSLRSDFVIIVIWLPFSRAHPHV